MSSSVFAVVASAFFVRFRPPAERERDRPRRERDPLRLRELLLNYQYEVPKCQWSGKGGKRGHFGIPPSRTMTGGYSGIPDRNHEPAPTCFCFFFASSSTSRAFAVAPAHPRPLAATCDYKARRNAKPSSSHRTSRHCSPARLPCLVSPIALPDVDDRRNPGISHDATCEASDLHPGCGSCLQSRRRGGKRRERKRSCKKTKMPYPP